MPFRNYWKIRLDRKDGQTLGVVTYNDGKWRFLSDRKLPDAKRSTYSELFRLGFSMADIEAKLNTDASDPAPWAAAPTFFIKQIELTSLTATILVRPNEPPRPAGVDF